MHANDLERIRQAYRVIGVTPDSSTLRIKRAYRRLAKTWHPDKWPTGSVESQHAGEQMRQINDAFRLIQHAPLRYRFEAQPDAAPRAERTQQSPTQNSEPVTDRVEYAIRIVAGAIFGCFVGFLALLTGLPVPIVLVIPIATAAGAAIYGDDFWRWALKYLV